MSAATLPSTAPGLEDAPLATPATRLRELYQALLAAYGPQHWWPSQSDIETVIGAYLTQNTAWRNVERSIANLRNADALTVDALRALPIEDLRTHIRPSGYMVRKALAIKAFLALLDIHHGGSLATLASAPIAEASESLLALPGVGPETADAILLYALHQPVMVVDEYLRRVATRHNLIPEPARYADLQQLAVQAFHGEPTPELRAHYNEFHALIVEVGKNHCGGIPRCTGCPLNQPRFDPPAAPAVAPRIPASKRAPRL